MIQLCYISTARATVDEAAVRLLLAQSRRNNARVNVTGLLLFNGKRFLQILEGAPAQVEATYDRILTDDRHFALVKLSERQIAEREFGGWDMAYERFAEERGRNGVAAKVAEMTRQASPSVRSLFNSYVEV